jgi:superfamily II DNA/RNA helicase
VLGRIFTITASTRDDLAQKYFDQLPFPPYPVQEDALLAWFASDSGVLVCAPTGTGKTLIAEAAAFEALHTGRVLYYTTPLIALTEQKFHELQQSAVRWGFPAERVGLVTGNRKVNPEATVLVVVAEILLNRLLHKEAFDFEQVSAVVMDEFHSFSDPERGIVWEFALSLLPESVRLLLLSATIGNAVDFVLWLERCHQRRLELVQSTERKVPLNFRWVPDQLLVDHLEEMAAGESEHRRTPALVFCFNREECWSLAEEIKGRSLLAEGQQKQLSIELAKHDWSKGVGPKLKQLLIRGVGVHHAGVLPRYKRLVEHLFQKKLLSVCLCTETLAAGINLPARSVVLPSLLKGKPGDQKLIDPSSAHQMFGRAGRPQFDKEGYVYALPHPDDVQILRWKQKYDQIPEDTKDPQLIKAKKALKKKQPTRSPERQYWNESQFEKLRLSPPAQLVSRGAIPWRLLAYLLQLSPDVDRLRELVRKRLMDSKAIDQGERQLEQRLLTLYAGDYVQLEPPPPEPSASNTESGMPLNGGDAATTTSNRTGPSSDAAPPIIGNRWLSEQLQSALDRQRVAQGQAAAAPPPPPPVRYRPLKAIPTPRLSQLFVFRSIHPLYGQFLLRHLGLADRCERLQLLESVLEFPRGLIRYVRVPPPHRMPPGPLARERVDAEIIARGILPAGDLYPEFDPDIPFEERKYAPPLADKVRMWFDHECPDVTDLQTTAVWVAGDLLDFGGDFFKYVSGRDLVKQEGLVFRHVLRLILLLGEFAQVTPDGVEPAQWQSDLRELAVALTSACHRADPNSTDAALVHAQETDPVLADVQVAPATSSFLGQVVQVVDAAQADQDSAFGVTANADSTAAAATAAATEPDDTAEFGAGLADED